MAPPFVNMTYFRTPDSVIEKVANDFFERSEGR